MQASDKDCGTRIGGEERPTPGAACATATPKGSRDVHLLHWDLQEALSTAGVYGRERNNGGARRTAIGW